MQFQLFLRLSRLLVYSLFLLLFSSPSSTLGGAEEDNAGEAENSFQENSLWEGEFVAGSFILTQNSLNEAPYRHAGVLRKALDDVETKDPPSQSDERKCDVRYRIRPSGK